MTVITKDFMGRIQNERKHEVWRNSLVAQTFFLMYEQFSRTCDVLMTSTPYLSSWSR